MSRIKSKDTKAEIMVRRALWRKGYRFRKNYNGVAGTPDIAFTALKIAVFIDGGFWHGYHWKKQKAKLKSNREFWIAKIERNMDRDRKTRMKLVRQGWKVIRLWEHDINKKFEQSVRKVVEAINARKA